MGLPNWVTHVFSDSRPEPGAKVGQAGFAFGLVASDAATPSRGKAIVESAHREPTRWVPPGESVNIHGLTLPDGMVYVGRSIPSVSNRSESGGASEPAVIEPSLPVDSTNMGWASTRLGYWPSYSRMSPPSRAAYLHWLAAGRRVPEVPIGYIFVFFYGLERRVLVDLLTHGSGNSHTAGNPHASGESHAADVQTELADIAMEVDGLIDTYGQYESFYSHATSFAAILDVMGSRDATVVRPPPLIERRWEIPVNIRVGLARIVNAGAPLPVDWALTWLRSHPDTHFRTPATRCTSEFEALWALRYKEQFGDGLVVKPNRTRLKLHYAPASASFGTSINLPVVNLPDVATLRTPINQLSSLARQCEDELDAYSRYLGRNPGAADSLAAIALLPPELAAQHGGTIINTLCSWIEGRLAANPTATIPVGELAPLWPTAAPKPTKTESLALAQLLAKRGYGIEPDVRFGGAPLGKGSVVLFRLPHGSPTTASDEYSATTVLLHLAAAVATADGQASTAEQHHFALHLEDAFHFDSAERLRLEAHLCWLLTSGAPLAGLTHRIESLSGAQREDIGRFAVAIATANGTVRRTEIAMLVKIYGLLRLDFSAVYNEIHALSATGGAAIEPVTIRRGMPQPGYAIAGLPPKAFEPAVEVVLNMDRVRSTLQDSARVAALLGDIFVEDEAGAAAFVAPRQDGQTPLIEGLDAAHSAFLRALGQHSHWQRCDVEELAASHGLLPDGALDTLNETAFDRCGDPVCDGDDAIEIDAAILKELLS